MSTLGHEGESEFEKSQDPRNAEYWYKGRLIWIGPELFAVSKLGTVRTDGKDELLPVDVEKVEVGEAGW